MSSDDPQSRPPTLRDIAKRSGLALSTVSDALNGKKGVAEATRRQVIGVAEAMGWRPNPLVSAWMSHVRTHADTPATQGLAYVVADREGLAHHFAVPSYEQYWEGVKTRAGELGFQAEIFSYYETGGKRLSDILYHRGIGPLIFSPLGEPAALDMAWERFSSVSIAYSLLSPILHHVSSHHFQVVQEAIAQLIEAGYERIGFAIPTDIDVRTAGMMSGSYLHARAFLNPDKLVEPFCRPFASFTDRKFQAWVKREKPDAVLGIIWGDQWLRDTGIPWISLDLKSKDAGMPGIQQHPRRIGAAAVDLVTAHWLRQDTGLPAFPKTSLIQGEWVS